MPPRKRKFEETKQDPIEQDEQNEQVVQDEQEEKFIFRCDICEARFIKGCGLASHMRTHYTFGLACPACPLISKTKLALNRHMRFAHGSKHPVGSLPPLEEDEDIVPPASEPTPPKEEIKKEDDMSLHAPQKPQKQAPTAAGPSTQPSSSLVKQPVEEKLVAPPAASIQQKLPYTCPICQHGFETKMRAAYHFQSHRKKKWMMPKTAKTEYRKLGTEKNIGFNIGSKLVEKWRMNCEYRPISVRRTQLWHFMQENFGCPLDKTFMTDQTSTRVQRVLRSQPGTSSAPSLKRPPPHLIQKSKFAKDLSVPKMKKMLMKGKTIFGQMLCLGSKTFYLCRGCPYVTWNQSSLWRHTRRHIHRSKNAYTCSACTYSSIHLQNIQHHVKAHKRVMDVKQDYADWVRYEREINCPDFSGALGDEVDTITVPSKKRKVLPTTKKVTNSRLGSREVPQNAIPTTPKSTAPKVEEFPSPPSLLHKDQYVYTDSKALSARTSRALPTSPPVLQPMQEVPPKAVSLTSATSVSTRPVRTTTSSARAAESTELANSPVVKVTRASARNAQTTPQAASVSSNKTAQQGIRTGQPPSKLARTSQLSSSIPTIPAESKDIRWPSLISTLSNDPNGPDYSPIHMRKLATAQKTVESTKAVLPAELHAGKAVSAASTSAPPIKAVNKNVEVARLFQATSSTKSNPVAAKLAGAATPNTRGAVMAALTSSGKAKASATSFVVAKPLPVVAATLAADRTTPVLAKTVTTTVISAQTVPEVTKATPTTSRIVEVIPAVPKASKTTLSTLGSVKGSSSVKTDKATTKEPGTTTLATSKATSTTPGTAKTLPTVLGPVKNAATTSATKKATPPIPATVKTPTEAVKATSAATLTTKATPFGQAVKPVTSDQSKTAVTSKSTPSCIAKGATSAGVISKNVKPTHPTSSNVEEVSALSTPKPSTSTPVITPISTPKLPLSTAVTPKEASKPVLVNKVSGFAPDTIAPSKVSKETKTVAKPTSYGVSTQSAKNVPVNPKPVTVVAPKVATLAFDVPTNAGQNDPKDNSSGPSTSTSSDPSTDVVPAAKPRYRLMVQYNAIPTKPPKLFKVLITSPEKDPPPKKETRSTAERLEPLAKKPTCGLNQVTTTATMARVVSSSTSKSNGSIDQPLNKVYANMAARVHSSKQKIELTELKAPGRASQLGLKTNKNRKSQEPTSSAATAKPTPPLRKSARTIAMEEKIKRAEEDKKMREEEKERERLWNEDYERRRQLRLQQAQQKSSSSEPSWLKSRRRPSPGRIAIDKVDTKKEEKKKQQTAAANKVLAEYAAEQKARQEKHEREWAEKHGSIPAPELKCNITAAELYHRIVAAKYGLTIPGADEPIPETPPPPPVLKTATGKKAKVQHEIPEETRKLRLHPLIRKHTPSNEPYFEMLVKQYKENEALKRANALPGQEHVPVEKLVMKNQKQRDYLKTEAKVERTGQCADCPFHDRKNLERLRRHRDKHFLNSVHKCTECNYSNFDRHDVQTHMFVDHYLNDVRAVEGISSTESEEDEPLPPPPPKKKAKRRRHAKW